MKTHIVTISVVLLSTLTCIAEDTRPNILLCIADDWGWPHAGAYGDEAVQTPTFDSIAEHGIMFEHAYVSSPSCTPSRNSLLTGRYHWELGPGAQLWSTLPEDLETYPHLLETAGYVIGRSGKSWGPGRLDGKWKEKHPAGPNFESFTHFIDSIESTKAPFAFFLGTSDPHRPFEKGKGVESGINLSKVHLFGHFPDSEEVRSDVADYYFEVERFDRLVLRAIKLLERKGLLKNTIIIMTGDHGMPFPRAKSNCYDAGVRVPLAIQWPAGNLQQHTISEHFVSLVDLAPTLLDAARVEIPEEMSGNSFLGMLFGGPPQTDRSRIIFGKERHVPSQEAPDMGGYPTRGIRNHEFLYLRNYEPDRWPNGTPYWMHAAMRGIWYGDTDNGPTKDYMIENKDKDDYHFHKWELAFGRRPAEELYDLKNDPDQLNNIADEPEYRETLEEMSAELDLLLKKYNDPRSPEHEMIDWDSMPYLGRGPMHPLAKKE